MGSKGDNMISIVQADAIDFLLAQPEGSIDLVFGSPPYGQARLYLEDGQDLGISRTTNDWVKWMVKVYVAAQAACNGLVAFVVAGQTRNFRWSAGPALLMAELHKAGLNLRNPPVYSRVGIPGSGGPDWLRADYEWIICTSRPGRLPWSDNTSCGAPCVYGPGGAMSHRIKNGNRARRNKIPMDRGRKGTDSVQRYTPPDIANPGNIIDCGAVGGGNIGSELAHENEAPFPEKLAAFFVLSFCPPGGLCCDPFSGSGTVAAMSKKHGRNFVGCDLRQSQIDIGLERVIQEQALMFT